MTFADMALAASKRRSAILRDYIGTSIAVCLKETAIKSSGHASLLLKRFIALFRKWQGRERERAFLAALQEFELRDMGLTPEDRRREINKAFWQE